MNIFEGARRVAWAVVWMSLAISIFLIFTFEPRATLHYAIPNYGVPAKQVDECKNQPEDASHYLDMRSGSGRAYSVQLCFIATKSNNGSKLISYKESGDFFIMNTKYSEEVTQYMQQVADTYTSANPDVTKIEKILDANKNEYTWSVFKWLAIFLFTFFIFVSGIGWIVRGFVGIPRGHDRKSRPD